MSKSYWTLKTIDPKNIVVSQVWRHSHLNDQVSQGYVQLGSFTKEEISGQDLTKRLTKVLKIKVCERMMIEQFVQKWEKKKDANLKIHKYSAKVKKNCLTYLECGSLQHFWQHYLLICLKTYLLLRENIDTRLQTVRSNEQDMKNKAIFSSKNSKQKKKQNVIFYFYIWL